MDDDTFADRTIERDAPSPEPSSEAFDKAGFKAWIDLISYDQEKGRLKSPPIPFDGAAGVNRVLAALRDDCARQGDLLSNLLYTIGILPDLVAQKAHVLHPRLIEPVDLHERIVGVRLHCDLVRFASGRFSIEAGSGDLRFARDVIYELFVHLRERLWREGFLDVIPGAQRKKAVVVNGRYRTGSTRVFNAVMAVLDAAGQPYKTLGRDFGRVDMALDCFKAGAYDGYWLLVKSHNWIPCAADDDVITFYTVRNLSDVAASAWRLWDRSGSPEEASDPTNRRMQGATLIAELGFQKLLNGYVARQAPMITLDYDRYIADERGLIGDIAAILRLPLTPERLEAAAREIAPEYAKAVSDTMDEAEHPTKRLVRRHISETLGAKHAGLHVLPSWVIRYLRAIGEWPLPDKVSVFTPVEVIAELVALPAACELLAPGELIAASEVAYRNKNFVLAAQAMKRLVDQTAPEPRHWCRLASFQQLAGDIPGAIESYRAAAALDGSLEIAQAGLAKALLASGDPDDALEAIELLAPGELVSASEVAYRNGDFALAVQAMKRLVDRTSSEPRHWCRLANCQQLAGDIPGAIESYRAAVALDGSLEIARAGLIKALIASGDPDDALEAARRQDAAAGGAPRGIATARHLYHARQFAEAIELLSELAAAPAAGAEVHRLLASALVEAGRRNEALEPAIRATELAPERSDYWHFAAMVANSLGYPERAFEWIARAVALDPENPALLLAQAHLLNGRGLLADATGVLELAARRFPLDTAIRELRQALSAHPAGARGAA
jgi:tetratricopeptide (TPR) repeat protein